MQDNRFFKIISTLIISLLTLNLLFTSGCSIIAGDVKEHNVESEEVEQAAEPYSYQEFGLESLGLSKNMSIEEVTGILGEPLRIEAHDVMGPQTTLYYHGLSLAFDQGLKYFNLSIPDITGARGIRVGDPIEKVLSGYLLENEVPNIWLNPDVDFWPDLNEQCVELYYFEPDDEGLAKTGVIYCDETTGEIIKVTYSHFLPQSCGYSGITFYIENGLVNEIRRDGF